MNRRAEMAEQLSRMIYINIAVKDLKKSIDFFTKLGFTFNPLFTNESATCMIINDKAFVMLLTEQFFKGFTTKVIANTDQQTECLLTISCQSREEVNNIVNTAIEAGGKHAMKPIDHGFMYGWSFYDLDNHHWEVMWIDPNADQ